MIALIFAGAFGVLLAIRITNWIRNYLQARTYGLPILLLPVSFNEPLWMPFRPLFAWVESLPFGLGNWYLYTTMGWPTEDGARSVHLYGENFVLCSPVDVVVVTAEPAVIDKVWNDHRDIWRVPESQSRLFVFFGENVSSTQGDDWKRHRKIVMQAFSERIMADVWNESCKQTQELTASLEMEPERSFGRIRSTFDVLAMKVLANVAFGQETELTSVPKGHKMSLMDSMGFILKHILLTVVFNSLKAPDFLLPSMLKRLKTSVADVKLYMEELILAHMQSSSNPKPSHTTTTTTRGPSLLSALVNANEHEKHLDNPTGAKRNHLTTSELYGNIFVFNLAGFETTASTLTFALPFLALHPEIQTWLAEEIDAHFPASSSSSSSQDTPTPNSYTSTFPHLPRTLALMHETLRLASPAPLFIKTPTHPIPLTLTTPSGPRTITISPGTLLGMNQYGAHLSPRWGPDAQSFDPRRFIRTGAGDAASGADKEKEKEKEKVAIPQGVSYTPWMVGPRTCPARKFSQVEFAGIVGGLVRGWRVEVVRREVVDGVGGGQVALESEEQAKDRVGRLLRDGKFFNVSAHLKRPEEAGVRFVRREE